MMWVCDTSVFSFECWMPFDAAACFKSGGANRELQASLTNTDPALHSPSLAPVIQMQGTFKNLQWTKVNENTGDLRDAQPKTEI